MGKTPTNPMGMILWAFNNLWIKNSKPAILSPEEKVSISIHILSRGCPPIIPKLIFAFIAASFLFLQ